MAEAKLNIYQKLSKIRKQVEIVQRDKKGYGYTYVSEEEILPKITALMRTNGLSLIPGILGGTTEVVPYLTKKTKATKTGEFYEENVNEILVKADMAFTWVNDENPSENVVVPWVLVGHQADASQSFGSGLSYSMRYFLLKFFNVATPTSDPDAYRAKQRNAIEEENREITGEIIKKLDELVRVYLTDHKDSADEVKKLFEKYVKGGDYYKIKEPILASKLLGDFKTQFLGQEAE